MLLQGEQRLRLRRKTPPAGGQQPLEGDLGLGDEDDTARRQVYLVTLPHPRATHSAEGVPLTAPETLTKDSGVDPAPPSYAFGGHNHLGSCAKQWLSAGAHVEVPNVAWADAASAPHQEQVLDAMRRACAQPVYHSHQCRLRNATVPVAMMAVFRELHRPGPDEVAHAHYHIALRASDKFRFMPVKRSLMAHCGLASHWSTHDGYWSALRNCWLPSPAKPMASLDRRPALWSAEGPHPPMDTAVNEPMTASAVAARRAAMETAAAEQGTTAPKVTEVDAYAIVVAQGFRNTADSRHADKATGAATNHAHDANSVCVVAYLGLGRRGLLRANVHGASQKHGQAGPAQAASNILP
jgi:hypothetical protein